MPGDNPVDPNQAHIGNLEQARKSGAILGANTSVRPSSAPAPLGRANPGHPPVPTRPLPAVPPRNSRSGSRVAPVPTSLRQTNEYAGFPSSHARLSAFFSEDATSATEPTPARTSTTPPLPTSTPIPPPSMLDLLNILRVSMANSGVAQQELENKYPFFKQIIAGSYLINQNFFGDVTRMIVGQPIGANEFYRHLSYVILLNLCLLGDIGWTIRIAQLPGGMGKSQFQLISKLLPQGNAIAYTEYLKAWLHIPLNKISVTAPTFPEGLSQIFISSSALNNVLNEELIFIQDYLNNKTLDYIISNPDEQLEKITEVPFHGNILQALKPHSGFWPLYNSHIGTENKVLEILPIPSQSPEYNFLNNTKLSFLHYMYLASKSREFFGLNFSKYCVRGPLQPHTRMPTPPPLPRPVSAPPGIINPLFQPGDGELNIRGIQPRVLMGTSLKEEEDSPRDSSPTGTPRSPTNNQPIFVDTAQSLPLPPPPPFPSAPPTPPAVVPTNIRYTPVICHSKMAAEQLITSSPYWRDTHFIAYFKDDQVRTIGKTALYIAQPYKKQTKHHKLAWNPQQQAWFPLPSTLTGHLSADYLPRGFILPTTGYIYSQESLDCTLTDKASEELYKYIATHIAPTLYPNNIVFV